MAGKVSKTLLYKSKITPDLRAIKLLFSLKDRKDDSILLAITKEIEEEGITLLDITLFSSPFSRPKGSSQKTALPMMSGKTSSSAGRLQKRSEGWT